jgi:transposase
VRRIARAVVRFVSADKGDNLAGLYSLVACEAHDVDPVAYLRDVLLRVDTHPASRIDELLPHRWNPRPASRFEPYVKTSSAGRLRDGCTLRT